MLNGVLININSLGINQSGFANGAFINNVNSATENDTLLIYCLKVYIPETISFNGNNQLALPVAFGDNKLVLFINGTAYYPNKDFIPNGNLCTWLNANVSISPSDTVIAWGPANRYTSKVITFERIDINSTLFNSSDTNHSNKPTFRLTPDLMLPTPDPDVYPYSQDNVFLFINGKEQDTTKFTLSPGDNKVVYEDQLNNPISSLDDVFMFYFNKKTTTPFNLGESLYRINLTADTLNQASFNLTAVPIPSLLNAVNLFYKEDRYVSGSDFTVSFPQLLISNTGNLKPQIQINDTIDISYFKSGSVVSVVGMFNQYLLGNVGLGFTQEDLLNPNLWTLFMNPFTYTLDPKKEFVYFRGLLFTQLYYDNHSSNQGILTDLGISPQYRMGNTKIIFDMDSRTPHLTPPFTGDYVEFSAFTDSLSFQHVKMNYFSRNNAGPNSITNPDPIKQDKVICWYNGEALFKEFGQITVASDVVSNFVYGAPPSGFIDEIVIMSFNDTAYANLWYFDYFIAGSDINAGSNITFSNRISDLNSCMLFVDGQKIPNALISIVPNTNNKTIILNGVNIVTGSKVMLVHL